MTRSKATVQKRRRATVADVINAITRDSVADLLVKRSVTAAVAAGALARTEQLMGREKAKYDTRLQALYEHLHREQSRGASTTKLRAPRRPGEVVRYKSRPRPGGKARVFVTPLATIGDPEDIDVAFGTDWIIIARVGGVTARDALRAVEAEDGELANASPDEILAELRRRAGGVS